MVSAGKPDQSPNRVFHLPFHPEDKAIAVKLAGFLGKDAAWVDSMDLDTGQMLPKAIAEGVQASKWFVLIASKRSMQSRWARYELNLALIKWIEQADCEIIVARVDHCEIHPELAPFLRIDSPGQPDEALRQVARAITKTAASLENR